MDVALIKEGLPMAADCPFEALALLGGSF